MDKTGAAWKTRRLNRGSALKTKQVFFNNVKGKKTTHARTKKEGICCANICVCEYVKNKVQLTLRYIQPAL